MDETELAALLRDTIKAFTLPIAHVGSGTFGANEYDLARAVLASSLFREAKAEAWDEGHAASERDWKFSFDITTPDEDRQPLANPYRS